MDWTHEQVQRLEEMAAAGYSGSAEYGIARLADGLANERRAHRHDGILLKGAQMRVAS